MRSLVHDIEALAAKLTGRNSKRTPVPVISEQLKEPRPLPIGRTQFEEWSDRIIAGAMLDVDHESLKAALCTMILHLGPTESHKPDAHFIHSLRKGAVNQTADMLRLEYFNKVKARTAEEEAQAKLAADHPDNVTPIGGNPPA